MMIEDCAEEGKEVDELLKIFSSFISDKISDFQTDIYYQNPGYLECSYEAGYLLDWKKERSGGDPLNNSALIHV